MYKGKKLYKIIVVNGPNINLLGDRETEIYGSTTLTNINKNLNEIAQHHVVSIEFFQSNHEGEIIDKLQTLKNVFNFIIINPASLTHTSISLRDTLLAIQIPFIEVHLSNPFKREYFRKKSYISDIAFGVILGLGKQVYELALLAAINYCKKATMNVKVR